MQDIKEEAEKTKDKKMATATLPKINTGATKTITTAVYNENGTTIKMPSSARAVCLCSPTTHPGSFRCRLHRTNNYNLDGGRELMLPGSRGSSIGFDLSDLASKSNHRGLQPQ